MWKFGVMAVAVGLTTLVLTIVIGGPLIDPDDAAEPAVVAAPVRTWAQKASDECNDAIASIRAELSGATGLASTAERAVVLFGATTEIEGNLLKVLRALPPSARQRMRVDKTLDLLEKQYKRDLATTAKLERRYDFALLNQEVVAYERVATQMRAYFGGLGAQRCVDYFDPETYR